MEESGQATSLWSTELLVFLIWLGVATISAMAVLAVASYREERHQWGRDKAVDVRFVGLVCSAIWPLAIVAAVVAAVFAVPFFAASKGAGWLGARHRERQYVWADPFGRR